MKLIGNAIFLFSLLIAGSFCAYVSIEENESMGDKISERPFKTVCAGRFNIDVPQDSILRFKGTYFAGWIVGTALEMSVDDIEEEIKAIKIDISSKKNEKNRPSLEKFIRIKDGDKRGAIFVYDRRWFNMDDDGRKWISEIVQVRAIVKLKNVIYRFDRQYGVDGDDEYLFELIKNMTYRENEEIPNTEGYCINKGFFYGMGRVEYTETTAISVILKNHPDVAIVFSTAGSINSPKPLLQRDKNDLKDKYRWRFHVIRKGGRSIDGMPGDEIVETVNEPNGTHSQSFMWESYGKREDLYRPVMSFELNSGHGPREPVNASLSDKEALALWEKMSASIRRSPFISQ